MLSLGPGSVCDVCLEPFGHDNKSPCSIICGHVFCQECLNHISRPRCPLCRTQFEHGSFLKLHVDVDNVRSSLGTTSQPPPPSPTVTEQEARRLQEAIASVANKGSTEPSLRHLIAECKTFLAEQPRHLFTDLRVSLRMVAYLCDVKSTLRSQNQAVDSLKEQVGLMESEKGDLERKVDYLAALRRDEKETALAVELSLREHCSRAHAAYEAILEYYNFVVSQWEILNKEHKRLHPHVQDSNNIHYAVHDAKLAFPASWSSHLDPVGLKGAAVPDEGSFLISPLPEFTGRLPSTMEGFTALPEIDDEKKPRGFDMYSSSCNSPNHPVSCHCAPFPHFPTEAPPISYATRPASSRRPSVVERATSVVSGPDPTPTALVLESPSALSLTAPKDYDPLDRRQSRSHSFSSRPSSRSRTSSRPPTRSTTPSRPISSSPGHGRLNFPHEAKPFSPHHTAPQGREGEVLRTRLHDLLQEPMSTSMPNIPLGHFSSSIGREAQLPSEEAIPLTPSRAGSSLSHRVPLPSDQSQQAGEHPQTSPPHLPLSTLASSPAIAIPGARAGVAAAASSSASSAALALEKAQRAERERQRREREQERERRSSDRDRDRSDRERDRDRLARDRDRERTQDRSRGDRDHVRVDAERTRPSAVSSSQSYTSPASASLSRQGSVNVNIHTRSSTSSTTPRDSANGYTTPSHRYPTIGVTKNIVPTVTTSNSSVGLYA